MAHVWLTHSPSLPCYAVTFRNEKLVKRVHVPERVNAIVNRSVPGAPSLALCFAIQLTDHCFLHPCYAVQTMLVHARRLNKTKKVVEVDHEQQRIERESAEARRKRDAANEKVRAPHRHHCLSDQRQCQHPRPPTAPR